MARTQLRKDSLLTRGPTEPLTWTRMVANGEKKSVKNEGEDRLRSAAIPLVRSWADRRAAMEFMRLGVG